MIKFLLLPALSLGFLSTAQAQGSRSLDYGFFLNDLQKGAAVYPVAYPNFANHQPTCIFVIPEAVLGYHPRELVKNFQLLVSDGTSSINDPRKPVTPRLVGRVLEYSLQNLGSLYVTWVGLRTLKSGVTIGRVADAATTSASRPVRLSIVRGECGAFSR